MGDGKIKYLPNGSSTVKKWFVYNIDVVVPDSDVYIAMETRLSSPVPPPPPALILKSL